MVRYIESSTGEGKEDGESNLTNGVRKKFREPKKKKKILSLEM